MLAVRWSGRVGGDVKEGGVRREERGKTEVLGVREC